MSKLNGGIIGPDNVPTGAFGSASGVWSLSDVTNYKKQGTWPVALTGHQVDNSLRFDDGSSDYLSRTPSSASNRRTWTWSSWIKTATTSGDKGIFSASTDASNRNAINLSNEGYFIFDYEVGGTRNVLSSQDKTFRDVSAWYHLVVAVDTTQATDTNRVKMYVNGSQISLTGVVNNYPSQNADMFVNNNVSHSIGKQDWGSAYLDGYMAEVVLVDGQQLTPTSFGETDSVTNNWVPKDVSGLTFGTNGFYLDFENSGSLGADVSGNGNNFTVNNLTSIDQSVDTCTNNFATLNPLQTDSSGNTSFSEGNNKFQATTSDWVGTASTQGTNTGKWYAEFKLSTLTTAAMIGVATDVYMSDRGVTDFVGFTSGLSNYAYAKYFTGGADANEGKIFQQDQTQNTYGSNTGGSTGDIIGVALDLDNNKLYFSINGTWENSGDPAGNSNGYTIGAGTYQFGVWGYQSTSEANFGSPPYSISSGNTDFSGMGNFEYAVPSGYYSLCKRNLNLIG